MIRSPLFDLFDQQNRLPTLDDYEVGGVINRKRRIEDLMTPEEQASMLQDLANAGASGVSGLGWLLDTPAAMVRGGLSKGIGKALAALYETSDQRVSGRELNRQMGIAGEKDSWPNFFGGLVTEVGLDPLTVLSLGLAPLAGAIAKTASGRLATKAGMTAMDLGLAAKKLGLPGKATLMRQAPETLLGAMPEGLAREARERFMQLGGDKADALLKAPMSAGNRLSIPGLYDGAFDMYGKRVGDAIARGADNLGLAADAVPYLGGAIRAANALVDSRRKGFNTPSGQYLGRGLTQAEGFAGEVAERRLSGDMVDAARGVGEEVFRTKAFGDAVRDHMEGFDDAIPFFLRPLFEPGMPGAVLANKQRLAQRDAIRAARQQGIPLESTKLPNDIRYMFRQAVTVDNPRVPKDFPTTNPVGYDPTYNIHGLGAGRRSRRDYTAALPSHVLNRMAKDGRLQESLRAVTDSGDDARRLIDNWIATRAPEFSRKLQGAGPYDYITAKIPGDSIEELAEGQAKVKANYQALADRLRRLPLQHAEQKIPFFGNPLNDMAQYNRSRAKAGAASEVLLDHIAQNLTPGMARDVPGGRNFTAREALEELGFDTKVRRKQVYSTGEMALAKALGVSPIGLATMSIPKQALAEVQTKLQRARVPREATGLLKGFDKFQNSFKSLALLFPARYTRDMYSGSFASASQGALDPTLRDNFRGAAIGRGSYDSIPNQVRKLPDYRALETPANLNRLRASAPKYKSMTDAQLHDELMIRKFLADAGGQRLTQANVTDDMGRQASNLTMTETAPGFAGPYLQGIGRKRRENPTALEFLRRGPDGKLRFNLERNLFFAQRSREGNPNWLLDAGDRAASASDNFNRIGAYLNRIKKGDAPRAARALTDLTQVNYRPEAFTEFEREVVKRLVPFYSFTKGIAPLVAGDVLNRPAGLMGQSIRGINRASEPTEDRHTPEYLRQSAAIPLPKDLPFLGLDTPGVTRFLTNIDLPHEGLINLFTPGTGNTLGARVQNSAIKTGQNLLGMTSPALKGPLEYFTDRQFFSGRQLSDLYSMAEKYGIPGGRVVDQLVSNLPGGSRITGVARQLLDDRISLPERLAKLGVNTFTGLKLQDVDQDRTVRLAARSALNELLKQAPGIGTYENIFIKPEALEKLSPQEQRQFLLYRILQSQAARKSREKKKAAAAADPMQMLGFR